MSLRNKIIKNLVAKMMTGWSDGTIQEQRAKQEKPSQYARLPKGVHYQVIEVDGISAAWISVPEGDLGVILYLHGGAYALGSVTVYRDFLARLVRATKMRCLAINYRLAPEHPFPAALEDAATAYRWLLAQGYDSSQIFIAGDSAGGGLTLATLVTLRDGDEPLPAGCILISPWLDLTLAGESVDSKAKLDPILSRASLQKYAGYYAGENELASPLISPLYADLGGLPPMIIHVGTHEILLDDATQCADKAQKAGVNVSLKIWDEMFHGFQLVPFLSATRKILDDTVAFIAQYIQ